MNYSFKSIIPKRNKAVGKAITSALFTTPQELSYKPPFKTTPEAAKIGDIEQPYKATEEAKPKVHRENKNPGIYLVGPDGKAPKGLLPGDRVVTNDGIYVITSSYQDGTYDSKLVDTKTTTSTYKGQYQNTRNPIVTIGRVYKVEVDGKAPKGLQVGDQVVSGGGIYTINNVNPDGTYESTLTEKNITTADYQGDYENSNSRRGVSNYVINNPDGTTTEVSNYYLDALEKAKEANRLAAERAVNQLESQKKAVNDTYDRLQRQAYQSYMSANKALPEQMANMGLDEQGASESTQVALNAAYGANVNENSLARQAGLAEIDQVVSDVYLQGDIAGAQQIASYYEQLAARNEAQQDKQYALKQYEKETAKQEAYDLIQSGIVTPEIAEKAGLTIEQANELAYGIKLENAILKAQLSGYEGSGLKELGISKERYEEYFKKKQ